MRKIREIKKEIAQLEAVLTNKKISDLTRALANQHIQVLKWVLKE